jgi:hypothetical protein
MEPGTRVEVRSRFDATWARGFEIIEAVDDDGVRRYRLRRRSDQAVLPVLFDEDDVRADHRKRDSMWWV